MKKISLSLLAVLILVLFSCVKDNEKVKFSVEIQTKKGEAYKQVKDGDIFEVNNNFIYEGDNKTLGFLGKLKTDKEFILLIDLEREVVNENIISEVCIDMCPMSNGKKNQQYEFIIKKLEEKIEGKCKFDNDVTGSNTVTYTLYPKDDNNNKITFKVKFIKS